MTKKKAAANTTIANAVPTKFGAAVVGFGEVCAPTVASHDKQTTQNRIAVDFFISSPQSSGCLNVFKSFGTTLYLTKSRYIWAQKKEEKLISYLLLLAYSIAASLGKATPINASFQC